MVRGRRLQRGAARTLSIRSRLKLEWYVSTVWESAGEHKRASCGKRAQIRSNGERSGRDGWRQCCLRLRRGPLRESVAGAIGAIHTTRALRRGGHVSSRGHCARCFCARLATSTRPHTEARRISISSRSPVSTVILEPRRSLPLSVHPLCLYLSLLLAPSNRLVIASAACSRSLSVFAKPPSWQRHGWARSRQCRRRHGTCNPGDWRVEPSPSGPRPVHACSTI